jgi:hypothetical protein
MEDNKYAITQFKFIVKANKPIQELFSRIVAYSVGLTDDYSSNEDLIEAEKFKEEIKDNIFEELVLYKEDLCYFEYFSGIRNDETEFYILFNKVLLQKERQLLINRIEKFAEEHDFKIVGYSGILEVKCSIQREISYDDKDVLVSNKWKAFSDEEYNQLF